MQLDEIISRLKSNYHGNWRQDEKYRWRFEVMTEKGRSQVVHLLYKEILNQEKDYSRLIAESPIGPVQQRFNFEILLRKNAELDVGTICIEDLRNDENLIVPYLTLRASHLVQSAEFEEVLEMIEKISYMADSLENEIFARDLH